mgnify:CR=1 FL=1
MENQTNAVAVPQSSNIAETFNVVKLMSPSQMVPLSAEYLTLKEGESYMLYVEGFTEFPNAETGEMLDAVTGYQQDTVNGGIKPFINAGTVLVSSMIRAHAHIPCFIYVYCKGEKGSGSKKYQDLDIRRVPVSK